MAFEIFDEIYKLASCFKIMTPEISMYPKGRGNGIDVILKLHGKEYKEERKICSLIGDMDKNRIVLFKRVKEDNLFRNASEAGGIGINWKVIENLRPKDVIQIELSRKNKRKTVKEYYYISHRKFVEKAQFKHFKGNKLELQGIVPLEEFRKKN